MLLKQTLPARRARLAGAILVGLATLGSAGVALAGHSSAMLAASALAAASTHDPNNTGLPYDVKFQMSVNGKRVANPAVIAVAGETQMVMAKPADGQGTPWGLRFHVDAEPRLHSMMLTGDVFTTTDPQHVIGYAKLIRPTGTPFAIAVNDKSGASYRIDAQVSDLQPPPAPPAPPPPPAPQRLGAMTAPLPPLPPSPRALSPLTPSSLRAPLAPLASMSEVPAPPAPPPPLPRPAHTNYASNAIAPAAPAPPAPPAPAAPQVPAIAPTPPTPPSLDGANTAPPAYPAAALAKNIGGQVNVKIFIGADGFVKRAVVMSSQPAGVFDQSALEAARRWHFNPGRNAKGQPVPAVVMVPVKFDPKG